ncbi:hypothetical protein A2331_00540 [Candidatus Falkowbacteria bacterium RIFOXYB2_FULL_34_18]|uniref:Cohesin domain-containing protein n=1 Tax=Candidatus Falkowbacteria bacterium RIFOXYD2_FULL_34_120 TaxID=1798007 RepID=A0A1F5TNX9_9BACT|nr:MAG: hypothetical protein A2331_00540 [Candidatus Falkowbacteria bacterium RIFOXYB2_FULL_34_18]OGF29042.1 MAG: hypothetical protein A2500_01940 [Candidatus Falkowbacteria bacterium RIFOXYC12_FULL_34_55]OGF36075.1 MAG: hypothetical protein A2466_00240 [Candidatus Falkowbacteria bacterium RIFOXYC2_FULL_34_220]OGF38553.1 MAG: hypothetical protein A2515_05200 [Candidatus Falkowbacteria bacterium RIFOXYD12_FULL_34_57]OGF40702.1 MAG: hypothetical protein A2531_05670 [Candidatus Falkowbacteria bact
MIKKLNILLSIILFVILIPFESRASSLYLDPAETSIGPGGDISVDIKIDIGEECINTIDANLSFDANFLRLMDFLIGDSIVSIWLVKPETEDFNSINDSGIIHISGGIPGGYCGKIPGDPGQSNTVGRLIFRMPSMIVTDDKKDFVGINFLDSAKVLINDGFGTEDNISLSGANVQILEKRITPQDDWKLQIQEDKIKPNPFVIELRQDSGIFGGKYYLNFFTIDKQSGMDYYEVLEIRPGEEVGVEPKSDFLDRLLKLNRPAPIWKKAKIPYLLEDQTLQSIIRVKARDKAGNERIVEYIPDADRKVEPVKLPIYQNKTVVLIVISTIAAILGLLLIIAVIKIIKKIIRKKYEGE